MDISKINTNLSPSMHRESGPNPRDDHVMFTTTTRSRERKSADMKMTISIIFAGLVACQLVCGTVQLARQRENNDVLLQYGYSKIDANYKTHYFEEQVRL